MVVDDHPVNRKLARRLLELEGYHVVGAASAAEAYAALAEIRPDLIVMDLHLPDVDGLELTRRLKADPQTSEIRIVAFTAAAMKRDEEAAYAAGCDGYVSKPVDTRTFASFIASHLPGALATEMA